MTNPAPTAPRLSTDADTTPTVMPTLRGWETKIREYADREGISIGRSKAQRIALKIHKRSARMQYVDPDDLIRKVLQHTDVTGEEAVGLYVRQPALDRDRQPYAHLRL